MQVTRSPGRVPCGGVARLVICDADECIKAPSPVYAPRPGNAAGVHFQRIALAHAGNSSRRVATTFTPNDHADASKQWRQVADQIRGRLPKLANLVDDAEEDVLTYMTFPPQHRAKLRSINPIKRLNGEMKRRTDATSACSWDTMLSPVDVRGLTAEQRRVGRRATSNGNESAPKVGTPAQSFNSPKSASQLSI
nr:transposase [Aurantimonas marina]